MIKLNFFLKCPFILTIVFISSCATPPVLNPKIPTEAEYSVLPEWNEIKQGFKIASIKIKSIPLIMYAVKIDLQNPNLKIIASEKDLFIKKGNRYDGTMKAETVLSFAKRHKTTAAINGALFEYKSFFFDLTRKVLGLHIVEGKLLSPPNERYAALLFTKDKQAFIISSQKEPLPEGIEIGISGIYQILKEGKVLPSKIKVGDSRTCVGIADNGKTVIILMIEAENTVKSQGLDFESSAEYLRRLGAQDGIQLDGGSSSTLVLKQGKQYKVLVPSISFLPLRKNTSCLGFIIE